MGIVETYFRDIIAVRDTNLTLFECHAQNYFNDIAFFSKMHRQYDKELEAYTSYKFNVFKYIDTNEN